MTISALPTPPSRADDPGTFSSKSDALLGALPVFVTEANAAVTVINAASANVDAAMAAGLANAAANAATATTQAGLATTNGAAQVSLAAVHSDNAQVKATAANNSAIAAAASAASIAGGPVASINGATGIVTLKTINGAAIVGSGDITAGASLVRSARTSNTILGVADKGTLIDFSAAGQTTQTFSAAATLGSGWYCYIKGATYALITLDPNGSEKIDDMTSFIMYPGEVRLIQCDGLALRSIVLNAFSMTFTNSDTFIKPPGYQAFEGLMWGGGGSGRRDSTATTKSGGGGGACTPIYFSASVLASSEAVTIGAGGAAQATDGNNGNDGGTSAFAGISAFGGIKGTTASALGGSAYVASISITMSTTLGAGSATDLAWTVYGGGSCTGAAGRGKTVWGGQAGGYMTAGDVLITPGETIYGGAGGAGVASGAGIAGSVPGGGGGPSKTAASGAGARGELRLWGII